MKTFGDMSWSEKQKIKKGRVNTFKYNTGYTFDVKRKVDMGHKKNT